MQSVLIILSVVIITLLLSAINELYCHFKYNDFEWINIIGNTLFTLAASILIIYGILPNIK
jgi:TRAP-type mannitol/chloroaromatic compound transport system permease small subunit